MRDIYDQILRVMMMMAVLSMAGCGNPSENNADKQPEQTKNTPVVSSPVDSAKRSTPVAPPVDPAKLSEVADFLQHDLASKLNGTNDEASNKKDFPTVRKATSDELRQVGLRIDGLIVEQGGLQLFRDDIIAFVNSQPVSTPNQFQEVLYSAEDQLVPILVYRDGLPEHIEVRVPKHAPSDSMQRTKPLTDKMALRGAKPPGKASVLGSHSVKELPKEPTFTESDEVMIVDDEQVIAGTMDAQEFGSVMDQLSEQGRTNQNQNRYATNFEEMVDRNDIDELIRTLDSPSGEMRMNAELALADLGPGAEQAIPALIDALQDQDESVRMGAAIALGSIARGESALRVAAGLMTALNDPSPIVRAEAALSIGRVGLSGAKAQAANRVLKRLLEDDYPGVQKAAQEALMNLSFN